jgi:hypothetical protein
MTRPLCPWCERPFTPRRTGGRPQRFCCSRCRRAFERELRAWARNQIEAGEITPDQLQRVRSRDGPSLGDHTQVPEIVSRNTGTTRALSSPQSGNQP